MKPWIGVVPLVDKEKKSYWMLPGYMEGIRQAGGLPVMMPLTEDLYEIRQMADRLDGFLFTGGQDVSPSVYGQTKQKWCGECCKERDTMEALLFQRVLELDKPILGICRGIQLINALMGGSLYQDLDEEHPSNTKHHQSPPYDIPCHKVSIQKESPLYELLQTEELPVNSYHHQAVKELSPDLLPMAVSEDGLIEAVYAPQKRFVWALQWHPEFSFSADNHSRMIFRKFVEGCRRC